jgi:hypothetical protein
MRSYRWSTERVLVVGLTVALVMLGVAQTAEAVLISYDIHDGVPANPLYTVNYYSTAGNFMIGIEVPEYTGWFTVERIWFYHGGDYAESGVPYRVYLAYRAIAYPGGIEHFGQERELDGQTTCNYCWEEVDVHWFFNSSSTFDFAAGIFLRPLSGTPASPEPQFWVDICPNHYHLACVLSVLDKAGGNREVDRDMLYFDFYMSDYGIGEVLVGMEIDNPFVTPVETRTFSAVKSLYD